MLKDKLSLEERNNAIDCLKQWSQKENDTQSLIYKTWYGFCYPFVQDVLGFHWIDYLVLSSIIKPKKDEAIIEFGAGYPLHIFYSHNIGEKGRHVGIDKTVKTVNISNKILKTLGMDDYNFHSVGNIFDVQCEDGLFDKAVAVNLWTGEPSFDKFLKKRPYQEFFRILRKGGEYHERFLTVPFDNGKKRIKEGLENEGFSNVNVRLSPGGFPFVHAQVYAKK
ncbi:MAG TPA: methyltransferase domain-containing protein [Candidatus Nanoarchaeia archaeon]|nr:methyltransferase domain-containing protein [Candidatus Nanoarchaeia archaeon]